MYRRQLSLQKYERMFYNITEVINMIDKSLPEEYQRETNYRKIPRQYLNPRIPKGRLNVKWAPFATMPQ